ncbi:MAG: hypothetical protein ACI9TP_002592, partial [Candidatus Azotimanducaceae bacterium]
VKFMSQGMNTFTGPIDSASHSRAHQNATESSSQKFS